MRSSSLKYIFILLFLFCINSMIAAPISLKAKLDSVQLLMGNMTMLNLELVVEKGTKGELPLFREVAKEGFVGINGDSIELRGVAKLDTIDLGTGRQQINYSVPLQSFDSGVYVLPRFEYIAGKDTVFSNNLVLKVVPVIVGDNEAISGFMPVEEPLNVSIFDQLPDWLYDYWWIIVIILLMIGAIIYLIIRFKQTGSLNLVKKKELLPHEVALFNLEKLKNKKLWEQGMEREYFTELTEILRIYLQSRFRINAMEMTTRQIVEMLGSSAEISDKKEYVKQILDVADFVKFAQLRPLPSENTEAFDNAIRFVNETKPIENEESKENVSLNRKESEK